MQKGIFETTTHAKCILAGEHSVLRGYPALVTPVASTTLLLQYQPTTQALMIEESASTEDKRISPLFEELLRNALLLLNKDPSALRGRFHLKNNIPVGGGIGFSAAICVALARWFVWQNWLANEQLEHFARRLEDHFHGKSSGVDIVGAMAEPKHVIHYEISGEIYEIIPDWRPKLFLSYSGISKNTATAISKVNSLKEKLPQRSDEIDKRMKSSVEKIETSLQMDKTKGFPLLIEGIQRANDCFVEWDLITPELNQYINQLKVLGALVTKPTGAGTGGFVLSLWENDPPKQEEIEFIAVF